MDSLGVDPLASNTIFADTSGDPLHSILLLIRPTVWKVQHRPCPGVAIGPAVVMTYVR